MPGKLKLKLIKTKIRYRFFATCHVLEPEAVAGIRLQLDAYLPFHHPPYQIYGFLWFLSLYSDIPFY